MDLVAFMLILAAYYEIPVDQVDCSLRLNDTRPDLEDVESQLLTVDAAAKVDQVWRSKLETKKTCPQTFFSLKTEVEAEIQKKIDRVPFIF